jgi:hypothetical protein
MKFNDYINEMTRDRYGAGITFVDIDETMFRTFAKVLVKKDGKVVKELDNQQFNSYNLKDGEEFDFKQFRDAELFRSTSIPIKSSVNRIKKMLHQIEKMDSKSKVIFLTARADFDDKKTFLDTFRDHGIKIDSPNVYIERTGNMKTGTIDGNKKKVMMKYIKTGEYRRVRLIDDHLPNLKALKDIEDNLPKEIEMKVIEKYNIDTSLEKLPVISFYALWIKDDGSLVRV